MDGVRHRQSYGNILSAASSVGRNTPQPHHSHHHSSTARGLDTTQQQQASANRRQQVIQQPQRPHPLQHSSSTVTGVGPGIRRETRRSISIPVIGDNRIGGMFLFHLIYLIFDYLKSWLNFIFTQYFSLVPSGGRPTITRQSSRSRLSPAERGIPPQSHPSLKFRHSHSGTLPTSMVGQVPMDQLGMPQSGGRANHQDVHGGMLGIQPPLLLGSSPGSAPTPHEAAMMMEHHHAKGLVPPRSPRMKVPPPTIISPSVIQRSPGEAHHGSSMLRVLDNIGPALARLGKSIALSVEILATVGETIADENPDIRGDMLQSCRESRAQSNALEKMCEALSLSVNLSDISGGLQSLDVGSNSNQTIITNHTGGSSGGSGNVIVPTSGVVTSNAAIISSLSGSELEVLVRTLRQLLTAVTKILLLSDNVVVKQLLGKHWSNLY